MQTTLNPKLSDDPHDVLVVAPDVVLVAPTDEELSRLAHTMRHPSNPQTRAASDVPASPAVPPVDTTFRPAVSDVHIPGRRGSIGGRAARAFTAALLMAACTGAAVIAWQSYGDAAEQTIAQWMPQRILASLLPQEKPALPAQAAPPAVEATTAEAAPPQVAPPQPMLGAQTAAEGVAPATAVPSVESAATLRSMVQDIAGMGQEIEQLKASIDELKAGQQQMSREIAKASEAKASEHNLRPRISALPPRSIATRARARKPMPPLPPPQAAAAPPLPPAAAPHLPRQPEPLPQATAEPLSDPELASVPRPPMPVR